MTTSVEKYYERCSFLTQSMLLGWKVGNKPIWGKLIRYDENKWPSWEDWEGSKNKFIRPLCEMSNSVALFSVEWISDKPAVIELKKLVDTLFRTEGKHLICSNPMELVDNALFWTGGGMNDFNLILVFRFDVVKLEALLERFSFYQQAGKMSPRHGGEYSKINNFAKSVVKDGGFSVIFVGREVEIFYPINFHTVVMSAAEKVEKIRLEEAKTIKARVLLG